MRRRYGLLLVVAMIFLLLPVFCGAWLIGDFEIPVKKVKPKPKSTLFIYPEPADALIRILNIDPVFKQGMELKPGRYEVEVSKTGYDTKVQWLELQDGETKRFNITLSKVVVRRPEDSSGSSKTFRDSTTGMEFVWVPEGCFEMGSPSWEINHQSDEGPVHRVCVDGFWMGKYEVTNAEYRRFKSGHDSKSYKGNSLNGAKQPVINVSWEDAVAFAKWLSAKSTKTFRLPTEAEWEYACRAGTTTARFWGEGESLACRYANVNDLTSKKVNKFSWANFSCDDGYVVTAPVGSFRANGFGLHDMLGNVWEWCSDWYDKDYYKNSLIRNPQGASSSSLRVIRGGCWGSNPWGVRSAIRYRDSPGIRDYDLGFRLVASGRR